MQITPLAPGSTAPERRLATGGAERAAGRSPDRTAATRTEDTGEATIRGGLRTLNTDLNRQVAAAQQALEYLEQVRGDLQGLKAALSGKLAERGGEDADRRIAEGLQRFSERWRKRAAATANSLDGQLELARAGEARQRFSVRGLDLANLKRGDKETLVISAGGPEDVSVVLEPGLDDGEIVGRLGRALAPTGIEVSKDADGRLLLGVAESAWPVLRDSLAVKGGGQRFPAGQFSRVRGEALPEAISPQDWQADDAAALRRTLQEVLNALDLVRQAQEAIGRAIAEATHNLEASEASVAPEWAAAFVGDFETMAQRPRFQIFSAIAPALVAISRSRVVSLLQLG